MPAEFSSPLCFTLNHWRATLFLYRTFVPPNPI